MTVEAAETGLVAAVASAWAVAFLAPLLVRFAGPRAFAFLAIAPASLCLWFALAPAASFAVPWVPEFGVDFALRLDGLSRVFCLLITGLGALILVYCSGYFQSQTNLGRFAGAFLAFLASMLGLVLADDAILLFVFWELTSVTSFLLIGFKHRDSEARASASQALLVTGLGGLAMLAGLVLLAAQTGTFRLSEMGPLAASAPTAGAIFACILAGACAKSGQFPLHFWLPNAMAAPTPVSAFLHSATMVKAGVYLLARLKPALESLPWFSPSLTIVGGVTVLAAGGLILWQKDLKKLLACSTLCALGMLIFLLGQPGDYALKAFVALLVAHALYKCGLFLLAGVLDHETGCRDVYVLSGLRTLMPWSAVSGLLLLASSVGLVGFFGFFGKEYAVMAAGSPWAWVVLLGFALGGGAAAVRVGWTPFWRGGPSHPEAHEAGWSLLGPPLLLGVLGLAAGIGVGALGPAWLGPMGEAVAGRALGWKWSAIPPLHLAFFLGLGLLAAAVAAGLLLRQVSFGQAVSLDRWWRQGTEALPGAAAWVTRGTMPGRLRHSFAFLFLLASAAALAPPLMLGVPAWQGWGEMPRLHEIVLLTLASASAIAAVFTSGRLSALCLLGVTGAGIAILYLAFGAPDLALTQILVDLLTIVVAALLLHRLPRFKRISKPSTRARDAVLAGVFGASMAFLAWAVQMSPHSAPVAAEISARSVGEAYGRNVVNTILVDFRALDTLGEITVLAVAALGVYALMRLKRPQEESA